MENVENVERQCSFTKILRMILPLCLLRNNGTGPFRIFVTSFCLSQLVQRALLITQHISCISCYFSYNFAVVCQVNASTDVQALYELTPNNSPVMYFPAAITNMIYSTYATGNILALFGLIALRVRVSVRTQVLIGTSISTLCTGLIPPAYDYWPPSTLILKLIQGAAVAPTIPLIGHIVANWTPPAQVGLFIAILSSYSQFGIFVAMASAGPLCEYYGWRSIFYFNALCSAFVFLLWYLIFEDTPAQHKRLNDEERRMINHIETPVVKEKPNVPYREFFTNASVWAVLIAAIGNYTGISPIVVYSAAILKKAVNLTDMQASHFNAISFFMQFVFKIASAVSDGCKSLSESFKTRFFNTISCGLAGVLMIITAFLPVEKKILCAVFITITQGVIGFNSAGFNKAAMLVTRQYAYFIMSLIGVIISASTIVEPFLVWAIAPDTTWEQWFALLILHGAMLIMSNVVFCAVIKAEPAEFTKSQPEIKGDNDYAV